jgi:hypothetical protein
VLRRYGAAARATLLSAAAAFAWIALTAMPARAWTQDKFILGMWGDPCVDTPLAAHKERNEARHRLAREAHFNLGLGAASYGALAHIDSVIDLYADNDLSTFVQLLPADLHLPSTYDPNVKGFDRVPYTKTMTERAHFLPGHLSARRREHFYGYFLGDEPPAAPNYVALKNVLQDCKAYDPGALAYINLCPDYCFLTHQDFVAYAESLLNDPNPARRPDVVSFDYYPFARSGMVATYFDNLSVFRRIAGDRPLWATPQTAGFDDYIDPTPAQILFLTNCPIAYGAKGLIYFTYNLSTPHPNPGNFRSAIVNNCDTVTPLYEVVKSINAYLERVVGPVIMSSRLLGTYHVSAFPAGQVIPPTEILGSGRAGWIAGLTGAQILCGVFDGPDASFLWVVNKDIKNPRSAGLTLAGNRTGKVSIGPAEVSYAGGTSYQPWSTTYDPVHQITKLASVTLAPGEGRMIRLSH